ncbi:MAG: DUF3530 family protein [Candidatus Sedimenticola sp. PURPLELP]
MPQQAFFFSALFLFGALAWSSDLVRELRIAEEIEKTNLVGTPVRLKAGEVDYLGIHTEAEAKVPRGGVILLHGRGGHPDWSDVISPLRSELTKFGWETLSIQLPVAASDAPAWIYRDLVPDSFPRISFGVEYLKQRKINQVVLVGHGLGARMGAEFLGKGAPGEIKGFVAIGLPAMGSEATLEALKSTRLPMLDLYGSRDIDSVLESAAQRAKAAAAGGNTGYRQYEMLGADHNFQGMEGSLVTTVQSWMRKALP